MCDDTTVAIDHVLDNNNQYGQYIYIYIIMIMHNSCSLITHFAAHSPDNSLIGFVSGAARSSKKSKKYTKKNMALVYAKQDSYWIVS